MSERLNCELFQVRTNTNRFTIMRGLAVTAVGEKAFIDPQIEPHHHTSFGPAEPEQLKLALAKSLGQPKLVEQGSIHPGLLALSRLSEVKRYRLHPPAERPVGQVALVSVVSHDDNLLSVAGRTRRDELSVMLSHHTRVRNAYSASLFGPHVGLFVLTPGASLHVEHEVGSYFSNRHQIRLQYDPSSPDGLVHVHDSPATPPPAPPADTSGVREPLRPLPTGPLAAMAVELAQEPF